jgi:uroporphyrinogen decarboxylase
MEKAMEHIILDPKLIEAATAHIEDFYLDYYKRGFERIKGKVDFFSMGDDFATQRDLMISPEIWRKFFKPVYRKIFDLAKSYGLYIWFHSCGAIGEVLPDLIDIGMDVWESAQVHLPGNEPERLKREYGKDITFMGAVNTQSTLPYGTPEQVRREVRDRIRVLGKGGGYICGADHIIKEDVPIENALALFDEVLKFRGEGCTL